MLIPGLTIASIGAVAYWLAGILGFCGYGSTVGISPWLQPCWPPSSPLPLPYGRKRGNVLCSTLWNCACRDENQVKPGDEGMTISRLTPMGKARFNDRIYEVKSTGEYVDQKTEIVAIRMEGSKIIVKPKYPKSWQELDYTWLFLWQVLLPYGLFCISYPLACGFRPW